jgi:outer membrane lipoprotein-sorting protein
MSRSRWLLVVLCAVFASPIAAQTPPGTEERDPKAVALLNQCAAAYKALKGIHIRNRGEIKLGRHMALASEIWFQRPAHLRIASTKTRPSGDTVRTLIVCDGKLVWRWNGDTNAYTVEASRPSLVRTELSKVLVEGEMMIDGSPGPLISGGGSLALSSRKKDGIDVDVVTLVQSHESPKITATVEFYVRHSDKLLQGVSIVSKPAQGVSPDAGHIDTTNEVVEPNPKFAAGIFRFTPPPGAKPVGAQPKPASKGKPKSTKK